MIPEAAAPQDALVSPQVLLIVAVLILIAGGVAIAFIRNVRLERRIYWSCWLLGTSVAALSFLDKGWHAVAAAAAFGHTIAVLTAYLRTSYLKVGGRIFAFTLPNSRPDPPEDGSPPAPLPNPPPDAYGNVMTAAKYWWTIALFSGLMGFLVFQKGLTELSLGLAIVVVVLLAAAGHLDVRDGFPVARKQYFQLAVVVISSIPVFLTPILAYAVTYYWLASGGGADPHGANETVDDDPSG